ncbi:methyl-accepting chemotaxis protein [Elusimicrobium simillimum]|uniref:hypothetical protein n=1 Tax=Elusimicrobium simillimum TaxID=3143438 RepID=UPI003C6F67BC
MAETNNQPQPQAGQPPKQYPKFKRSILFIKRDLQLKYILLLVISVVIGLSLMAFEVLTTMQGIYSEYPMMLQPLYDKFVPITIGILLKIAIYLVIVVLVAAMLSHKLAGPIYRFEVTCKDIAGGNFAKRVHLREGDNFTDLQREFNRMMDVMEAEINKNKKDLPADNKEG